MSEEKFDPGQVELESDFKEDYGRDQSLANFNLSHLSLSNTVIKYLDADPILKDFKPLADQIMATNNLDDRNIRIYKNTFDSMILERTMQGGLTRDQHRKLDVARIYLHQIIDGCRKGYRGALVTELRRVYRTERGEQPQEKKGWLRR